MRRLLLLTALVAAACNTSTATECRLNSDCRAPLLCADGKCVPECREDRDCPQGQVCASDGTCGLAGDPARLCSRPRDCQQGETCQGGLCEPVGLVRDPDGGITIPGTDARPQQHADATGGNPDARPQGSDAGFPTGRDATSPPDTGPQVNLPYGAVCTSAFQCASTLCLGPQGASSGRCTRTCVNAGDCVSPDTCMEVPGAGYFCAASGGLQPTGAPCPGGGADCATGLCLTPQGSGPVCTQQCSPLPSCPGGMSCTPVADGMGGSVAVCAPGSGLGFGELCTGGSQCASQLCLGVGGAANGTCTSFCDQIPCPIGYTCSSVGDGSGGVVQICAPEGAVGGSFGATCTGSASCASGLCLYDARVQAAFCTRGCNTDGECAAVPGLACVNLGAATAVCAPP